MTNNNMWISMNLHVFLKSILIYVTEYYLIFIRNFNSLLDLYIIFELFGLNPTFDFNLLIASSTFLPADYLQIQESAILSEYFFLTSLFGLTLFSLFSLKPILGKKYFLIKFQYDNQLPFLVVLIIMCYLILVYQQINISLSTYLSFNDSIINDLFSISAKFIIGISSLCYLIFISDYIKEQRLSSLEYYLILLTSIFGFLLLCCSNNFITAYLAIELQGLAFYVLSAFKKSSNFSIESGVKYFIIGSLSTVFFLFGVAFVYGFSGSLLLTDYNDFFIWVFSKENIELSFESMVKASNNCNSFNLKLEIILDSLCLIKNKFHFCPLDFEVLNLTSPIEDWEGIFLFYDICIKIFDTYYELDTLSFKSEQFQINGFISTFNIYVEDSCCQEYSIEHYYDLLENSIENDKLVNDKGELIDAHMYEEYGIEFIALKDATFYFWMLSDDVIIEHYLERFILYMQSADLFNFGKMDLDLNLFNPASFFFKHDSIGLFECLNLLNFSFITFGMLFIILALIFKLALAPFHLWSPDVYEGSPSSSTFFFMTVSKLSLFIFLLRICYSSFYSFISYWQIYLLLIGSTSIFIGAVVGLKQRKIKSLLTYSSINNMGFVLLAFSVGSFDGIHAKFYYLIVYIITSLCFWAIILSLKLKKNRYIEKQNKDLGDLALLQESNNIIAQNLAIILFSMAGLPPMVGFIAKMAVFKALVGISAYLFSVINILCSVVATFYYLRVIKIVFYENLLVGSLYSPLNSRKVFLINLLCFLLIFFFIAPMSLYLYSYKIILFFNKSFY